jgi:hypothetical protein
MGRHVPWRPVVWFEVTVPVAPEPTFPDGIVTTVITSMGRGRPAQDTETLLSLGGLVLDATRVPAEPAVPVGEALVTLTDAAGRLTSRAFTGSDGRFVLEGVSPGTYRLAARAAALPPLTLPAVTLPAPADGPLELQFT